MMTITTSMMMMIRSCLVDPVSVEVANQSNSGRACSTLSQSGNGYVGPAEALVVQ